MSTRSQSDGGYRCPPSTREVLVTLIRRSILQHRYDSNIEEVFCKLPASPDLEDHPVLKAVRKMEHDFGEVDSAAVMEAQWRNDCRTTTVKEARKLYNYTLQQSLGEGMVTWTRIVRMMIIGCNLAEQQFKEDKIQRIPLMVEWTMQYFCKNNIEAWINAGNDGWNEVVACVCPPAPLAMSSPIKPAMRNIPRGAEPSLTDSESYYWKPSQRRVVKVPYKRCTPSPQQISLPRKPIAEQEPDTEHKKRQDSYLKKVHQREFPITNRDNSYFRQVPKFDFEKQKIIEKSSTADNKLSSSNSVKPIPADPKVLATKASTQEGSASPPPPPPPYESKLNVGGGEHPTGSAGKKKQQKKSVAEQIASSVPKQKDDPIITQTVTAPTPTASKTHPTTSKRNTTLKGDPSASQPNPAGKPVASSSPIPRHPSGNTNTNATQEQYRPTAVFQPKANMGTFTLPDSMQNPPAFLSGANAPCGTFMHSRQS